jgi:geranylgeranyl transferase type-2 subunit alpha
MVVKGQALQRVSTSSLKSRLDLASAVVVAALRLNTLFPPLPLAARMHGVKRDRNQLSAELKAQRKEKEAKKLQLYKTIEDQFFAFKNANAVSLEALELTSHLLRINPELYTAWNFRRKVLAGLFESEEEAIDSSEAEKVDFFASARIEEPGPSTNNQADTEDAKLKRKKALLVEDLDLTIEVLRIHPKVYWIWNHRKWCLQELPSGDEDSIAKWTMEIQMVNKMLDMDARNFHGWNYRRFILEQLATPKTLQAEGTSAFPGSLISPLPEPLKKHQLALAEQELQYTMTKIESNFSNFSAWHHRSLLLIPIWTARGLDVVQRREERDEEFELIRQAIFVDPEDQSVWTYHSWLIGLEPSADVLQREITSMKELLELEPDSKWCMVSLADYLSLLEMSSTDKDHRNDLKRQARILLERLIEVDPDRKERYQESINIAA